MLQHFSASRYAVRVTRSWCSVPSPRPPPRPRQIIPSCPRHRQLSTSRPHSRTAATLPSTSPSPPPLDSIQWLPLPRALGPTRSLFLLSLPVPPSKWPSHLDLVSPLLSSTSKALKPHGIGVNATYDGRNSGDFPPLGEKEVYSARLLWPDGHRVDFPQFDSDTLRSSEFQQALSYNPDERRSASVSSVPKGSSGKKEILICSHGSRDCRCSDRGLPLIRALRNELRRKGLEGRVDITEIAHVGGHKYAANAILLPSLDMLSNLTVEHAPALLDHLLDDTPRGSGMWTHWRGRYGLSTAQQEALWADISSPAPTAPLPQTRGEETTLRFKTFDGDIREVRAALGKNLLEVGKEHDLPALEGVCGGNLECATCHLYLPSSPEAAPVAEESEEELDMLGYALGYRDGESRLGCQIKVTKELGEWCAQGGTIGLPRY